MASPHNHLRICRKKIGNVIVIIVFETMTIIKGIIMVKNNDYSDNNDTFIILTMPRITLITWK